MNEKTSDYTPPRDGMLKRFRNWLRAALLFGSPDNTVKQALVEVLNESAEIAAQLPPEEKTMLKNMLNFGDMTVQDIMVARSEIQAVEHSVTLDELKHHVIEQRHTRVPVYEDKLDNVKGFIHIKDLFPVLSGDGVFDMSQMLRDVLFVPPSMKIIDLLVKMRLSRVHMAIVVDEYGGTDGLVTMEDLFEQIVGEIKDEHDEGEIQERLVWSPLRTCDVNARLEVYKIEKDLGITLYKDTEEDFDTIGGLIFFHLGRVPSKGEKIDYDETLRFEILDADPRRVKSIRITRLMPQPVAESA